jgi:hypothetical protein
MRRWRKTPPAHGEFGTSMISLLKLTGRGPLRMTGRRTEDGKDQLSEGGPRLRGAGTDASARSARGSRRRSISTRNGSGTTKE